MTLLACEPTGADALARSVAAGRPVDLADPHSIARSTVDNGTGRLAIAAASRDGAPVVVDDDAIADATRALARTGLYVETSSALALAGIRQARRDGVIAADALAVAVLTAHGRGWSENEPGLFDVAFADDVDGAAARDQYVTDARAVTPPSATTVAPVMIDASSEARNATTRAISTGSAIRPSGCSATTCARSGSRSSRLDAEPHHRRVRRPRHDAVDADPSAA